MREINNNQGSGIGNFPKVELNKGKPQSAEMPKVEDSAT